MRVSVKATGWRDGMQRLGDTQISCVGLMITAQTRHFIGIQGGI
jgi:hypothetical protein